VAAHDDVIQAIKNGDTERLHALVAEQPALATARDENGVSALMLALYHHRRELVDVLRPALAELDVFEAASLDDVDRVRDLLDRDPSLATARSSDEGTALHFAAFFGGLQAARVLLERGADPHSIAPRFGNVQPLHSAAASSQTEIGRLLLERGADPNARQGGGFTPLHAAAANGNRELATLLLDHGADPTLKTDDGRDALAFAQEKGDTELVAMLERRGAAK
jgi:ankyrin repeat protein